jgi:hypothetical protein
MMFFQNNKHKFQPYIAIRLVRATMNDDSEFQLKYAIGGNYILAKKFFTKAEVSNYLRP